MMLFSMQYVCVTACKLKAIVMSSIFLHFFKRFHNFIYVLWMEQLHVLSESKMVGEEKEIFTTNNMRLTDNIRNTSYDKQGAPWRRGMTKMGAMKGCGEEEREG